MTDISSPLSKVDPPTPSLADRLQNASKVISDSINTYYGTKLQIAQQKAAYQQAKAQGANAVATAQSGLPSPTALVIGGVGLLALVILTSGGKR